MDGTCKTCSSCDICSALVNANAKRECFNCLKKVPFELTQRVDGSCQKGCPPGLTYNVWTNNCSNGCDTDNCNCKGSDCQSCKNTSYTIYPEWKTCYLCETSNGSTKLDKICLKCNNIQYIDITNKSCKNCDTKYGAFCEYCDENKCLKCSQNAGYDTFQRNNCIECGVGFVKLGDYCIKKSSSCKTLSINSLKEDKNQIICDECVDPSYFKYDDGSCGQKCDDRHAIYEGNCISCKNNCLECPNLVECKRCDADKYIYDNQQCVTKSECTQYPLHYISGDSKQCSRCETDNGYYLESGICQKCHSNCKQCTGNKQNQCTVCYNGFQLMSDKTCFKCQIDDGFYLDSNQVCTKCNDECIKCKGPSNTDCITCKGALQLDPQQKKCVCTIQNCSQCSIDGTICLSCKTGFAGEKCNECNTNQGKYIENNQCKDCNTNCRTCKGGSEQDCMDCKISTFKVNPISKICSCAIDQCKQCNSDGTSCMICEAGYIYQNKKCEICDINNGYMLKDKLCQKCHSSCKRCKGLSDIDCIECSYIGFKIDQNTLKCYCPFENCQECAFDGKSCNKCIQGYVFENNQCQKCQVENCLECVQNSSNLCKTCENGYQLSEKQNKCSKNLQMQQYGFISSQEMNDDGYIINLTFDNPIHFTQNTQNDLNQIIKFKITNINEYKGQIESKSNKEIDIKIQLNETCKYEKFYIQIADDEFIQANQLNKTQDNIDLEIYIKKSAEDKQLSKDLSTTAKSITSTLAATIIPIALLGNFSILFSMLDITGYIYYLLYLNIRYPDCITSFCNQLDNFQFAFIPNALMYFLDNDYSQWAPKKFIENESDGYFLHGAGQSFTIICIVMSLYLILKCLSFIPIPKLQKYLNKKIKGGWEYSGFIDLIWTVYLYVLVSVLLQFYTFEIYDISSYFNYISFIICTLAVILIPIYFFKIIHNSINIKDDDFINERLGALVGGLKLYNQDEYKHNLVEEIKKQVNEDGLIIDQKQGEEQNQKNQDEGKNQNGNVDNQEQKGENNAGNEEFDIKSLMQSHKSQDNLKQSSTNVLSNRINLNLKPRRERLQIQISKYTNMFSYLRKFTFSLIIVFLYEYTYLQISLFIIQALIMGSYYLYILPHTSYFDNLKNGISEFILILILISAAILKDDPKEQDEQQRNKIGWVYIACTAAIIIVQAIDLAFELLRSLYQKIVSIFRKKSTKTAPLVNDKTSKIQSVQRPTLHRFTSQLTNLQINNPKYISSLLSLKSLDQTHQHSNLIAKHDDYNVGEIKDLTMNNHLYLELDSNSPVKSIRKKRGAQTYGSRILQNLPTKSNTNLVLQEQDSNFFEMSNNQVHQNIASVSRSFIDENTGRELRKK